MVELTEVFREYNRPLVIEGAAGFTAERWAGIEAWSAQTSVAEIPLLIEGVYGAGAGPASLWNSLQAKDEGFTAAAGSPAARLMSGAALDYLFTHNSNLDVPAALAVVSAGFGGRSPGDFPVDIVGRAADELEALADQRRERNSLADQIAAIKVAPLASNAIAEVTTEFNADKVVAALTDVLKVASRGLDKVAAETRRVLSQAEDQIALCEEESDVLWFVFGGDSQHAARPFKELSSGEAAIYAADELAAMTTLPLQSQMFKALLARLGVAKDEVALKAAAEKLPHAWIAELGEREPSARLFPIHRLLDRYLAFGSTGGTWSKGLQDVIGMSPSAKMDAAALSLQFYRERMLKKALET